MRLIETVDLSIDESILTGESKTVKKSTQLLQAQTIVAERSNMVFAGTIVATGK
jgi:magnesium-transporting ATPase (P-type)